jgi:signal transduction histidine kinase
MGFFFAAQLLKPIFKLQRASQALARGDLQQQVTNTSHDEIGQLVEAFNQMSADLHRADQQRKRLTADITHDLSTPLQIISGYVEMLEEEDLQLTPQRLEIIRTEIGHLRRLVDDLGILTQVEAGGLEMQIQKIYPAFLLEQIFQVYRPIAAHHGIQMELALPGSLPAILADEGRMLQVIKNLVENALRYTPAGGTVTLGVSLNDKMEISIKDTGSGIDPDDLPYVFDRFYRADKSRGANSGKMGLGLAICKALVTAQQGDITAHCTPNEPGTTMLMRFDPVVD